MQEICPYARDLKHSAEGLDPMAISHTSPARGLEPTAMSHTSSYRGSAPARPKAQWWKPESLHRQGEGFVTPAEGSTLQPGSGDQGEGQSSVMRTAAVPSNSEDSCSSDNENRQVCIRKISLRILLQENQQHKSFPFGSLFLCSSQQFSGGSSTSGTVLTQISQASQVDH
ncbi:hypothetical protein H920_03163 [Fukomys damarensis]|uniref:Uncharacterized protein n=1 Tax=Fukomys damarensis TaxID=885580 RepID=A0A091DYP4_FUKDA|nr:hypothetical protein H920_03163 [Fukomys damarensis]